eukprot:728015-Hanusia_phi.AAC.2
MSSSCRCHVTLPLAWAPTWTCLVRRRGSRRRSGRSWSSSWRRSGGSGGCSGGSGGGGGGSSSSSSLLVVHQSRACQGQELGVQLSSSPHSASLPV